MKGAFWPAGTSWMEGASKLVRIPGQAQVGEARLVLAGKVRPDSLAGNKGHQQHAGRNARHETSQAGARDAQDWQRHKGKDRPHAVINARDQQKPQVKRGKHDKGTTAGKQTQQHAEACGDAHASLEAEKAGASVAQHRRRHDKGEHGRRHAKRAAEKSHREQAFCYVAHHGEGAAPKNRRR